MKLLRAITALLALAVLGWALEGILEDLFVDRPPQSRAEWWIAGAIALAGVAGTIAAVDLALDLVRAAVNKPKDSARSRAA